MGAASGKRRRATVASALVPSPQDNAASHPPPNQEDVDGASDSSNENEGNEDDISSVGTDTSDTDLTNWRQIRGLPIAHKEIASSSGQPRRDHAT